jgi:hypothetical protein
MMRDEIEEHAAWCGQTVDDFLSACYLHARHAVHRPEPCDQCGRVQGGWYPLHRSDLRPGGICDQCYTDEVVAIWGEDP